MSEHNKMAMFDPNAGEFITTDYEPRHETISMNGIDIDKGIAPIIKSLWNQKITTMRSCQDCNGYVYIAFKKLRDAIKAGLLISDQFILTVVTNDWLGGYAAVAVMVPIDRAHVAFGQVNPEPIYNFLAPYINKVIRAYKRSGLLEVIYKSESRKNGEQVADDFKRLGGNFDRYVVVNANGIIRCEVVPT